MKAIQTIWCAIKRFSPVHRVKSKCNKRKSLEKSHRLYASHPDISHNNLVLLTQLETKRSQDDTDAIRTNTNKIKDSSVKKIYTMNPFDNQYNNSIDPDNVSSTKLVLKFYSNSHNLLVIRDV